MNGEETMWQRPKQRSSEVEVNPSYRMELWYLRQQCRVLQMEKCYNRYVERLVVTNVALFLFVMELLLLVHIVLINCVIANTALWTSTPYVVMMIFLPLILAVCFMDRQKFDQFNRYNILASCGAALLVCLMDTFASFLMMDSRYYLVSSYDHILLVSIYMLLPIGFFGYAFMLGLGVSLIYVLYSACTLIDEDTKPLDVMIDIGYYFIFNVTMGIFQCGMEHSLRQKVLSRRQLLQQNLLLKVVVQREKNMIQTILPSEIANSLQQEIRNRIEDQVHGTYHVTPRTLFVELHSDVSILVADMVNYTYLTTCLDVEDLVQILHELFLKFDMLAEQNNVLRIKFLGDAYNCVAGIPHFNRRHAKCCVALGLEMIEETHAMGSRRNLDIDLRIGVHSGEVFSGIIGRTKWQYDIWSRDVDIANRLEICGLGGAVHISQTTLSLLDNTYKYVESTERIVHDPNLRTAHILSYMIQPQRKIANIDYEIDSMKTLASTPSSMSIRVSVAESEEEIDEIRRKTQRDMIEKVEHMPVGRIQLARIFDFSKETETENEDILFRPHISSFWRLFRDSNIEWNFMNQPDSLMKYSLNLVLFVALVFFVLHAIQPYAKFYVKMGILLLLILIIAIAGYFKTLWFLMGSYFEWTQHRFFLTRWLFWVSMLIEDQLIVRISVSFCSIFLLYIMATLSTLECDPDEFELIMIEADVANKRLTFICFDPWYVTQNVVVVLSLMFFFVGIPLVFKVGLLLFMCVSHMLTIHAYSFAWQRSETTNLDLAPEYAHIWYVLAFSLLVVIKEQHLTYISKVNFHSKLRFEDKLRQTENSTRSISIIMTNILPVHVANIFLDGGRRDELFTENYSKVAVMFARMLNFEAGLGGLRVLNEYICLYDDLLEEYESNIVKVEKIKVMGWTYMAACGLVAENLTNEYTKHPRRRGIYRMGSDRRSVRFGSVTRSENEMSMREPHVPRFVHPELNHDDNCVLTMVRFAQDMLIIMQDISMQNVYDGHGCSLRGQLQIGISHGPVMAGVVGLSPPHYDIWGHTVNMASRMSSTGVLGSIHITENTAKVLRQFDIKCVYRGQTAVKGIGEIPTYLVGLSNTLSLQYNDEYNVDDFNSFENIEIVERRSVSYSLDSTIYIDMYESVTDPQERATSEKGTQTARRKHR